MFIQCKEKSLDIIAENLAAYLSSICRDARFANVSGLVSICFQAVKERNYFRAGWYLATINEYLLRNKETAHLQAGFLTSTLQMINEVHLEQS